MHNLCCSLAQDAVVDQARWSGKLQSRILLVLEECHGFPRSTGGTSVPFHCIRRNACCGTFESHTSHSSLLPASNVLAMPGWYTFFIILTTCGQLYLMRLKKCLRYRSDLVDVIRHKTILRLEIDDNDNKDTVLKTEFSGWARVTELQECGIGPSWLPCWEKSSLPKL
jgi:hypothetical protein